MNTEYRRDTHHSYLVLYETEGRSKKSFQTRMFLENQIPGFLSCRMYDMDCTARYFYDISSRQSLSSLLETRTLDKKILETLLTSLLSALNGLQDYLLDSEGLCLQAEYIYWNPSMDSFEFCYYPEGEFVWREQLKQLSEYLLPHLEHKNGDAVRLGYDLYQASLNERITAVELEQILHGELDEKEEEKERRVITIQQQDLVQICGPSGKQTSIEVVPDTREGLLDSFFDSEDCTEDKKKVFPEELLPFIECSIPPVVGGVGAILFWFFRYDRAACVCLGITVVSLLFLLFRYWKKEREKEQRATMEQYVVVQDWIEEEKQEELLQQKEESKQMAGVSEYDDDSTCLLTSEEAYSRLAKGYLVPDSSVGGQTFSINKDITMIGKSNQMDVVLKFMGISRTHAKITIRGEDCYIMDMNSRNGTKLNECLLKPAEEQILSNGDHITFANTGYEWRCYRL